MVEILQWRCFPGQQELCTSVALGTVRLIGKKIVLHLNSLGSENIKVAFEGSLMLLPGFSSHSMCCFHLSVNTHPDRGEPWASGTESCEGEGSAVWAERGERRELLSFGFGEELCSSGAVSHKGDAPSKPWGTGWFRERVCWCHPGRSPWTISELLKEGMSSQCGSGLQELSVLVFAAAVQGLFLWQWPCAVPGISPLQQLWCFARAAQHED